VDKTNPFIWRGKIKNFFKNKNQFWIWKLFVNHIAHHQTSCTLGINTNDFVGVIFKFLEHNINNFGIQCLFVNAFVSGMWSRVF
jgi:hypothetical protein